MLEIRDIESGVKMTRLPRHMRAAPTGAISGGGKICDLNNELGDPTVFFDMA